MGHRALVSAAGGGRGAADRRQLGSDGQPTSTLPQLAPLLMPRAESIQNAATVHTMVSMPQVCWWKMRWEQVQQRTRQLIQLRLADAAARNPAGDLRSERGACRITPCSRRVCENLAAVPLQAPMVLLPPRQPALTPFQAAAGLTHGDVLEARVGVGAGHEALGVKHAVAAPRDGLLGEGGGGG
jgi:hypothetical protein